MQDMHPGSPPEVDLNLLASLAVLVRHCSVTRAAKELGLSQSAMSHRLARLRELFGDPLLVTGAEGMVPTARALQLALPISSGLREFETALRSQPDFDPATSSRRFVVASSDFGDFVVLPPCLARLRAEAPGTSTTLRRPSPDLPQLLERGVVDVAVLGGRAPEVAGLRQRRALVGAFACAVRADHPQVGEALDLETFVALPHLLISPTGEGQGLVDLALAELGRQRRVVARVASFVAAPFVAARSDLVLTAPVGILEAAALYAPLRLFVPPVKLPSDGATMLWHERWQRDAAHRWLREMMSEVMTELSHDIDLAGDAFTPGQELSVKDGAWLPARGKAGASKRSTPRKPSRAAPRTSKTAPKAPSKAKPSKGRRSRAS